MELHHNLDDYSFFIRMKTGTLKPSWFTHEAHLRLAWTALERYKLYDACQLVCEIIRSFDQRHGDGTKFHYTVTMAAVHAVHHFRLYDARCDFADFIGKHHRLLTDFKSLLRSHYTDTAWRDPAAKYRFVAPDLAPFPSA